MASIQKRGKDTYVLIAELGYDGRGKRIQRKKTVHVRTKKEAEAELRKWLAEIEAGTYVAPQKMTFEQFVKNEWIPKYAEKNLALTTRTKYVGQLRAHILPVLGGMRLEAIKTLHLVTLLDDLQKDGARKDGRPGRLTGATIWDIYKILKSVFSHAVKWKAIPSNPMDGVDRPKVQKRPPGYYEEAEAVEVIRALQDEPATWRLYFLGAMMGGFRRGELTALEWSDVDFDRGTITIRRSLAKTVNGEPVVKGTKTDESGRVVVMPSWYMDELRRFRLEWKKERMMTGDRWEGGEHEYVFHGGTGKPFYHSVPTQRWRKFMQKHNLRPIRLHDLRHTAATLLIEAGVDLKAVQERLGHSSYRVTADIYAHVTQKLAKETAEKLEKFAPDAIGNKSVTKR